MAFNGTGSNVTSLNANNISSGTVPTARLGSGTANSSTYLRGDQTYSALPTILPGLGGQVFTSSGTFTVPAGVTQVKVTVAGGGGSGGNARSTSTPTPRGTNVGSAYGGGGGGGGVTIKYVTGLTPGGTVSVTVGGSSGTSSFGAFCSATGGGTAAAGVGNSSTAGGAGGTGSGGDINITGGVGRSANSIVGTTTGSGGGGCTGGGQGVSWFVDFGACYSGIYLPYGGPQGLLGGTGAIPLQPITGNGNSASGFGNGGSGAVNINTPATTFTGGAGTAGIVIVEF